MKLQLPVTRGGGVEPSSARSDEQFGRPRAEGRGVARLAVEQRSLGPGVRLTSWFAEELGNSSYVLDVSGATTTIVIDPLRDADVYATELDRLGSRPVMALETHVHNDFVSGARELTALRHATIGASGEAPLRYPFRGFADGEEIGLGAFVLRVLATPGHTPEHVSYLLVGDGDTPVALFSGGAVMVGSAARTDLLGTALARPLAVRLYHTLQETLAHLPDSTLVFPTHGGGTFCGVSGSDRRSSTLGEERENNPYLRPTDLPSFVAKILDQGAYPAYFRRMRQVNCEGAPLRARTFDAVPALGAPEFDAANRGGGLVIDLRSSAASDAAHIPGCYHFGLDGSFSAWAGWLLPPDAPLLFVAEAPSDVRTAARQLFRIGYDRVAGYLDGGLGSWVSDGRPVESTPRIGSVDFDAALTTGRSLTVLDVREPEEYAAGHVPGAVNIPLGSLAERGGTLPRDSSVAVHCAHGYRSSVAVSLLERQGYRELLHVFEGYASWKAVERARSRTARGTGGAAPH